MSIDAAESGKPAQAPKGQNPKMLIPFVAGGAAVAIPIAILTHPSTTVAGVILAAALSPTVALRFLLGFYRCPPPTGWLLHVTSTDAGAAITANEQAGHVHLIASRGMGTFAPLIGATYPWRRRLYFFTRQPQARSLRFNVSPSKRAVAIWIRAEDLAASTDRFYRRGFDRAVAWPGTDYKRPAVVESATLDTRAASFGPHSEAS